MATLSFLNLECNRGGRQLFQGVDCILESGRWLYVAGANGAGKTSLMRMVCGLLPIDSGEIYWNELAISKQMDSYRKNICYVGHLNALQESLTLSESVIFAAALSGIALDHSQARDVLNRFGVKGRGQQLIRHLSQGQKRRVALTRLAVSTAQLWVLDEPFVGMDEAGIAMLADLVSVHLSEGGLALLTSHQFVDVGLIAPQVLELSP